MPASTNFKRILKYGYLGLWRNRWLTLSAISVMVITLLVLSTLLVINSLAERSAANLQDRVDISVFFDQGIEQAKLEEVKAEFESIEEIKAVRLITAEEALADFKAKHEGDDLVTKSLEELEENPLQPSLVIIAHNLDQYPIIFQKLQRSRFEPLIAKINYEDNRNLIDTLKRVTGGIQNFGILLTVIFGAVAILVMFNTLRLTIFSRREEIEIMRLVGASNSYIRGPFLVEGLIYGLLAAIIASVVLYPAITFAVPKLQVFFGFSLSDMSSLANILKLSVIQLLVGIALGTLSSILAIKKYLQI